MLLQEARITMFRSIEDSDPVPLDPQVTVLVGQNESGKTAFLQALYKAWPIEKGVQYDVVEDYPRRHLNTYERVHEDKPAVVTSLRYALQPDELAAINAAYDIELLREPTFTVESKYNNSRTINLSVPEKPYVDHLISKATLSSDVAGAVAKASTLRELIAILAKLDLNAEDGEFLEELQGRFGKAPANWHYMLAHEVWRDHIQPNIPRFLYFDDYYLLPGKVNLPQLQLRESNDTLRDEDKTVLSLLRLAGVELASVTASAGYEHARSRLEGISNAITDRIFEYWTQNRDLEVLIDIRDDPQDEPPFNNGNNLYIRIRNPRHRVTVPFSQRSRGFIWFFSFLVWFDSIKEQMGTDDTLVLLLDEPGLSLHALGQADLLRYIDSLAGEHQLLYTTHSPFLVQSDRLHQVRMVEDREKVGTKITENVSGSDPHTLFPLQAALGYTIAQNLFISKRNLLVEGPADLVYLQFFAAALDRLGRTGLRDDITVVPTGGLDKLATFVALLRGNKLEMIVLHDYAGRPDPHLESLVREKLVQQRQVLNYALYRDAGGPAAGAALPATDVEDLLSPALYLDLFNAAYAKELGGKKVKEADLPTGDRLVTRLERHLKDKALALRPSGGFNHYLPANHLAAHPPADSKIDADTLARFERLFEAVNRLYR